MEYLRNILASDYHTVSYLQFCTRRGHNNKDRVSENIAELRQAIINKPVVFIDWEHERVLDLHPGYDFLGFRKILGDHYHSNRWAIVLPTFGHKRWGSRQFNNLDFLMYVNKFNQDYDVSRIDHSRKSKDFLYLNGKPHPFRVHLLKELLQRDMLDNSVWSASSPMHSWLLLEKKLPEEYEWPRWKNKSVSGYDTITRQVRHPMHNDTICSIVPETMAENDYHYITEKTCKPIMAEHLFVVLSGARFLKNLRNLGFRTFHEHFDESYDECEDLSERIKKIVSTLEQIRQMDSEKLYEATAEIRTHNRLRFFDQGFYNKFNSDELEKIKKYFAAGF